MSKITHLFTRTSTFIGITLFTPLLAAAQLTTDWGGEGKPIKNVNDLTEKFTYLGNTAIQVLIAFAVIFIIFNVVRFLIVGADSEDSRKKAKDAILYGVIGLFVILSIWGLVNILLNTFVTDSRRVPTEQFPRIPIEDRR